MPRRTAAPASRNPGVIRRWLVMAHVEGDPPLFREVEADTARRARGLALEGLADNAICGVDCEELPPRAGDRAGWPADRSGVSQ